MNNWVGEIHMILNKAHEIEGSVRGLETFIPKKQDYRPWKQNAKIPLDIKYKTSFKTLNIVKDWKWMPPAEYSALSDGLSETVWKHEAGNSESMQDFWP